MKISFLIPRAHRSVSEKSQLFLCHTSRAYTKLLLTRHVWNLIHCQLLALWPNAEIILLKLNDGTILQHPTQSSRASCLVIGRVVKHSNRCPKRLCTTKTQLGKAWATWSVRDMLPILSRSLDYVTSRDPFQPQLSAELDDFASFSHISPTVKGHKNAAILALPC